jgi:hypothetical protein
MQFFVLTKLFIKFDGFFEPIKPSGPLARPVNSESVTPSVH